MLYLCVYIMHKDGVVDIPIDSIVLLRYRVQLSHFHNVRIQSPGTHYGRSDTVLIANVCGSIARPGAKVSFEIVNGQQSCDGIDLFIISQRKRVWSPSTTHSTQWCRLTSMIATGRYHVFLIFWEYSQCEVV